MGFRRKGRGIYYSSQKSHSGANWGVDCHKYSWTFNFYPHAPPPPHPARSSHLLWLHLCANNITLSPLSLCLSLFSHTAGGWLAQERGIINFLEWQTLDVQRAGLSHPLLGVPLLPSLLAVILLASSPPNSHPHISYTWCSVKGEWEDTYPISTSWEFIQYVFMYMYGVGGKFVYIHSTSVWLFNCCDSL